MTSKENIHSALCRHHAVRAARGACVPCIVLLLSFLCTRMDAQTITYNEDIPLRNQFTVGETGLGHLTPDLFYNTLHKDYKKWAASQNKQLFRMSMKESLVPQEGYAEALDSALTHRKRVEEMNVIDRTPSVTDLSYVVERKKIEGRLSQIRQTVNRITLEGGTAKDDSLWRMRYNALNCGLQAVRDAYMPSGKRKEQYLAIYKDATQQLVEVTKFVSYLRAVRQAKEARGKRRVPTLSKIDKKAEEARQRWRYTIESASTGIRNKNN